MKEVPSHCPLSKHVLFNHKKNTHIDGDRITESKYFRCACSNYGFIEFNDGVCTEIFIQGLYEIRVYYRKGEYERNLITIYKNANSIRIPSEKTEIKLEHEEFTAVFSRNNLHPLLEKIEKYEVFQ